MSSAVTLPGANTWSPEKLHCLSQHYLVERELYPEQSSGGIYLPDRYRDNWTQGIVHRVGPGLWGPHGNSTMWVEEGDRVLYQGHHFKHAGDPGMMFGFVRDEDLVGLWIEDRLDALNDWVQIQQEPDEEYASSHIIHAEEYRPKPLVGTILSHGPGKLRMKGELRATRQRVTEIVGLPHLTHLHGYRVWWSRDCEMLSIGREELESVLVRADDLMLMEWPE